MTQFKEPEIEFDSPAEKKLAKAELEQLMQHPGWKRIITYYDGLIDYYRKYLESGSVENMAEYHRIVDKRNMAEQFRNLPEILIGIDEININNRPQFDPYDSSPVENIDK